MPISPNDAITFHYLFTDFTFTKRKSLKHFILRLMAREGKRPVKLDFVFCDDEYLLQINKTYLKHDFYTDIITFDLSEDDKGVISEIYISIPRVRENAAHLQISFKHEIHRVIFHGLLHLCGYTDKQKEEMAKMRSKEDYYLGQYFI